MGRLDELDLTLSLTRKEEAERLMAAQARLLQLRLQLGGLVGDGRLGPPVLVLFEGWDASGKGGAIKRLVAPLDPRHVRVAQFAAPTYDEKRHHFLWRFGVALPGWGGMAVLDRSWYGRVLVERVERFATREQWERAYTEQLARFKRRAKDPLKSWKLTDEDFRNRKKRRAYEAAVEDMLERTSSEHAPWHLVEGDDKRYARVRVLDAVIADLERGMRERGFKPLPPPPESVEGVRRSRASKSKAKAAKTSSSRASR